MLWNIFFHFIPALCNSHSWPWTTGGEKITPFKEIITEILTQTALTLSQLSAVGNRGFNLYSRHVSVTVFNVADV